MISNLAIKGVSLGSNNIDDECINILGNYLRSNNHLESVDISNSQISDKGIEILASYLTSNTSLIHLGLFGNKNITDTSVPTLMAMINSSHIQDVDIDETSAIQKNGIIIPLVQNILKYESSKLQLSDR